MPLQLVTGGAGFIGSHLVDALVARGERVRVLDDLSSGRRENLAHHRPGGRGSGARVELLEAGLADAGACRAACEGVEVVYHQAAQVSVPRSIEQPEESYETNVMGTLRMLEGARRAGVRRFLLAASSAAYGDAPSLPKREDLPPEPLSPYASGKLAAEELLRVWSRVHGLSTVSLRYFNVFGPRQADDSRWPRDAVRASTATGSRRATSPSWPMWSRPTSAPRTPICRAAP
jgi:nucleoside-diphosphate-sugar epimerase